MKIISNSIRFYLSLMKKLVSCTLYNLLNRTEQIPSFPIEERVLNIRNRVHDEQLEIPKIIWMYWEEEKLPTIVSKSIQNIRSLHPGYEINLLNRSTLLNFLPDFKVTAEMPVANKTDLIRLELLYKFGGIWLDSTVIIKDSLDWIHDTQSRFNLDLIAYYRDKSTIDYNFPVIESWFLATPKNNEFIKDWLVQLSPLKDMGSKRYFEMIKSRNDYEGIKQKIHPVDYLLVYLACQLAMRNRNKFNFYLKRCEDSALFIQDFYEWDAKKINYALCRFIKPDGHIPIIKLTGEDRNYLQTFFHVGLMRKDSIIGSFFL